MKLRLLAAALAVICASSAAAASDAECLAEFVEEGYESSKGRTAISSATTVARVIEYCGYSPGNILVITDDMLGTDELTDSFRAFIRGMRRAVIVGTWENWIDDKAAVLATYPPIERSFTEDGRRKWSTVR